MKKCYVFQFCKKNVATINQYKVITIITANKFKLQYRIVSIFPSLFVLVTFLKNFIKKNKVATSSLMLFSFNSVFISSRNNFHFPFSYSHDTFPLIPK
jgi:hypothetical protein